MLVGLGAGAFFVQSPFLYEQKEKEFAWRVLASGPLALTVAVESTLHSARAGRLPPTVAVESRSHPQEMERSRKLEPSPKLG